MSLSWQKTKSGRFSRFMSEFQQSPKRCRSLVVETGFPTSIIDLFVKNRDRLKKSSSKRQPQTALNASSRPISPPIKPDVVPGREKTISVGGGLTAETKLASEKNVCGCGGNGRSGTLVLMAFKILIVAMLALSTEKKLTIGVTFSALALLLTELLAARVFELCNSDKKAISCADSRDNCGEEIRVPKSDMKSISCLEETKSVVASISKVLTIRDLLLKDEKSKSKSSGLKSKIVKKLRSFGKKNKKKTMKIKEESLTEVSRFVSEDKSERVESKRDKEISNPPVIASKGDQTNGIVLIVIVLTGLVYGKFLATVLTLSCLVVLRFGVGKKV